MKKRTGRSLFIVLLICMSTPVFAQAPFFPELLPPYPRIVAGFDSLLRKQGTYILQKCAAPNRQPCYQRNYQNTDRVTYFYGPAGEIVDKKKTWWTGTQWNDPFTPAYAHDSLGRLQYLIKTASVNQQPTVPFIHDSLVRQYNGNMATQLRKYYFTYPDYHSYYDPAPTSFTVQFDTLYYDSAGRTQRWVGWTGSQLGVPSTAGPSIITGHEDAQGRYYYTQDGVYRAFEYDNQARITLYWGKPYPQLEGEFEEPHDLYYKFKYDSSGRITSLYYPGPCYGPYGTTYHFSYDNAGRVIYTNNYCQPEQGSSPLYEYWYTYNPDGLVQLKKSGTDHVERQYDYYLYDSLQRLNRIRTYWPTGHDNQWFLAGQTVLFYSSGEQLRLIERFAYDYPDGRASAAERYLFAATDTAALSMPFDPYVQDVILSTGESVPKQELRVYPNPSAEGIFYVTVPGKQEGTVFTVINRIGQQVSSVPASGETTRIDLREQPSGIYLLCIPSAGGTVIKKLVK